MRKWLGLVLVLIIVGLCGAYYIAGVEAEKEFKIFIKSADNLPNLKVSAENYQRGWLKSTVHIHVVLHRPPQEYTQQGTLQTIPAQDVSFSFDMTIYHGPVIFANHHVAFGLGYAEAEVPLPDEVLSQFSQVFTANSTKPTFDISLLLRYAGKLDVNVNIPSFALTSKDGLAEINWQGFYGRWIVSKKLSNINGSITFNGMTFKIGGANGRVGPAHLKYNVKNQGKGILSGKATAELDTLQVVLGPQLSVAVDGFQAISESDIKNKSGVPLVDSSLEANVSKITYAGQDYGPGILDVSLSNLDAEALGQMQQKLQIASNENLTESQQKMFMLTLLPELTHLLGNGAEFQVNQLQLAIPQGLIIATAKINLPSQFSGNQNILQFIQQMHAHIMAEVPVAWLNDRLTDYFQRKIEQRQTMEVQMSASTTSDVAMQTHAESLTSTNNEAGSADVKAAQLLSLQEMHSLAKQQALEQLQNLVQNEVLIQKEDVYRMRITYKNGTLYINNKPFNNQQISEGTSNDSAQQ